MATNIAVNDIMSVRAWTTFGPQAAVNTYNFLAIATTGTGCTDQQLATAMDAIISPLYLTIMCDSATYNGVQVYFVKRTGVLPLPVKAVGAAGPGVGGTLALPRNTAAILKYSTSVRGPGGRGRLYLPFLPTDTMTAAGDPTAGFDTFVSSFASSLLSPIIVGTGPNTTTFGWILLHKGPPPSGTQLLVAGSASKFGQMHKRGDYGRQNSSPI